jgi:DNA-binding LacI/PurR family transcriptional regulator
MKRVTQKEIARAMGIHVSTVSKALKGDPAIAAATRARVLDKARSLGFQPDPMLSALASYRNRRRAQQYRATIAWLYNHRRSDSMHDFEGFDDYYEGAKARAEQLGYSLDTFWIDPGQGRATRIGSILQARGIRGVVIAPQSVPGRSIDLAWDHYAVIALGYTLKEPMIDRVSNDHFATMIDLLEGLHQHGYRKIGCYLWEVDNQRMAQRARSALLSLSEGYRSQVKVYQKFAPKDFLKWIRKHAFDSVICRGRREMDVLLDAGYKIPDQLGLAGYALSRDEKWATGMHHNNLQIGSAAIDWISTKLQHGEYGLSSCPQRLLVSSTWLENQTLCTPPR